MAQDPRHARISADEHRGAYSFSRYSIMSRKGLVGYSGYTDAMHSTSSQNIENTFHLLISMLLFFCCIVPIYFIYFHS